MGVVQSNMTRSYKRRSSSVESIRIPQRQKLTYERSEIIDKEEEAQLLSTVIGLALESKSQNGWNILAETRWNLLQRKLDPLSNRPIVRSMTRNKSTTTLKQMYDYFKMGDNKERGGHIIYHIDDDHDIEYVEDEETGTDSQYMCVRHRTSITDQSSKLSYKVVVRLIYDINELHPVYIPPPEKCTRAKVKCEAHVCFSRGSAQDTDFKLVCIAFAPDSGGLVSKSQENKVASTFAVKNMNILQKKCKEIPRILKRRKYNEKRKN